MSKKSVLDSMRVSSPCTEDWGQMTGNAKVRFCSHCSKNVNNISEMTPKEAVQLVRASDGNICIRYRVDPLTQSPVFARRLHQIGRAPLAATGVVAASLALSSGVFAQGGTAPELPGTFVIDTRTAGSVAAHPGEETHEVISTGSVSGRILDPAGVVVPGVTVELVDTADNGRSRTVSTNSDGVYTFDDVPPGSYLVKTYAEHGFGSNEGSSAVVSGEGTAVINLVLESRETWGTFLGGAMISVTEYKGAIASAVAADDLDTLMEPISHGEDVNAGEEDKTTPLFIAVENGNMEITETLLNFGAKVNARNKTNRTPLMMLDEDSTPELIEVLMRYGAKINLTDDDGNTALMLAARSVEPEVLKALVDAGADINLTNDQGRSALMNAASANQLENARILLLAGARVDLVDKEGETAWDMTGSESELEQLLETFGAEIPEVEEEVEGDTSDGTELTNN